MEMPTPMLLGLASWVELWRLEGTGAGMGMVISVVLALASWEGLSRVGRTGEGIGRLGILAVAISTSTSTSVTNGVQAVLTGLDVLLTTGGGTRVLDAG